MKRYNIFVILWAIYNSKRTKTPEDIEQINITNNRVKNDKLFPCLPPFFCMEITLSFSSSLSQMHTHSTDTHAHTHAETCTETCCQRCLANLSIKFASCSEVLEAVQLKDSLLVERR